MIDWNLVLKRQVICTLTRWFGNERSFSKSVSRTPASWTIGLIQTKKFTTKVVATWKRCLRLVVLIPNKFYNSEGGSLQTTLFNNLQMEGWHFASFMCLYCYQESKLPAVWPIRCKKKALQILIHSKEVFLVHSTTFKWKEGCIWTKRVQIHPKQP